MCALWHSHARMLYDCMQDHNDIKAHLFLEQLLLLPVNVQDKIIEEISHLPQCNSEAIASILGRYTIVDLP